MSEIFFIDQELNLKKFSFLFFSFFFSATDKWRRSLFKMDGWPVLVETRRGVRGRRHAHKGINAGETKPRGEA